MAQSGDPLGDVCRRIDSVIASMSPNRARRAPSSPTRSGPSQRRASFSQVDGGSGPTDSTTRSISTPSRHRRRSLSQAAAGDGPDGEDRNSVPPVPSLVEQVLAQSLLASAHPADGVLRSETFAGYADAQPQYSQSLSRRPPVPPRRGTPGTRPRPWRPNSSHIRPSEAPYLHHTAQGSPVDPESAAQVTMRPRGVGGPRAPAWLPLQATEAWPADDPSLQRSRLPSFASPLPFASSRPPLPPALATPGRGLQRRRSCVASAPAGGDESRGGRDDSSGSVHLSDFHAGDDGEEAAVVSRQLGDSALSAATPRRSSSGGPASASTMGPRDPRSVQDYAAAPGTGHAVHSRPPLHFAPRRGPSTTAPAAANDATPLSASAARFRDTVAAASAEAVAAVAVEQASRAAQARGMSAALQLWRVRARGAADDRRALAVATQWHDASRAKAELVAKAGAFAAWCAAVLAARPPLPLVGSGSVAAAAWAALRLRAKGLAEDDGGDAATLLAAAAAARRRASITAATSAASSIAAPAAGVAAVLAPPTTGLTLARRPRLFTQAQDAAAALLVRWVFARWAVRTRRLAAMRARAVDRLARGAFGRWRWWQERAAALQRLQHEAAGRIRARRRAAAFRAWHGAFSDQRVNARQSAQVAALAVCVGSAVSRLQRFAVCVWRADAWRRRAARICGAVAARVGRVRVAAALAVWRRRTRRWAQLRRAADADAAALGTVRCRAALRTWRAAAVSLRVQTRTTTALTALRARRAVAAWTVFAAASRSLGAIVSGLMAVRAQRAAARAIAHWRGVARTLARDRGATARADAWFAAYAARRCTGVWRRVARRLRALSQSSAALGAARSRTAFLAAVEAWKVFAAGRRGRRQARAQAAAAWRRRSLLRAFSLVASTARHLGAMKQAHLQHAVASRRSKLARAVAHWRGYAHCSAAHRVVSRGIRAAIAGATFREWLDAMRVVRMTRAAAEHYARTLLASATARWLSAMRRAAAMRAAWSALLAARRIRGAKGAVGAWRSFVAARRQLQRATARASRHHTRRSLLRPAFAALSAYVRRRRDWSIQGASAAASLCSSAARRVLAAWRRRLARRARLQGMVAALARLTQSRLALAALAKWWATLERRRILTARAVRHSNGRRALMVLRAWGRWRGRRVGVRRVLHLRLEAQARGRVRGALVAWRSSARQTTALRRRASALSRAVCRRAALHACTAWHLLALQSRALLRLGATVESRRLRTALASWSGVTCEQAAEERLWEAAGLYRAATSCRRAAHRWMVAAALRRRRRACGAAIRSELLPRRPWGAWQETLAAVVALRRSQERALGALHSRALLRHGLVTWAVAAGLRRLRAVLLLRVVRRRALRHWRSAAALAAVQGVALAGLLAWRIQSARLDAMRVWRWAARRAAALRRSHERCHASVVTKARRAVLARWAGAMRERLRQAAVLGQWALSRWASATRAVGLARRAAFSRKRASTRCRGPLGSLRRRAAGFVALWRRATARAASDRAHGAWVACRRAASALRWWASLALTHSIARLFAGTCRRRAKQRVMGAWRIAAICAAAQPPIEGVPIAPGAPSPTLGDTLLFERVFLAYSRPAPLPVLPAWGRPARHVSPQRGAASAAAAPRAALLPARRLSLGSTGRSSTLGGVGGGGGGGVVRSSRRPSSISGLLDQLDLSAISGVWDAADSEQEGEAVEAWGPEWARRRGSSAMPLQRLPAPRAPQQQPPSAAAAAAGAAAAAAGAAGSRAALLSHRAVDAAGWAALTRHLQRGGQQWQRQAAAAPSSRRLGLPSAAAFTRHATPCGQSGAPGLRMRAFILALLEATRAGSSSSSSSSSGGPFSDGGPAAPAAAPVSAAAALRRLTSSLAAHAGQALALVSQLDAPSPPHSSAAATRWATHLPAGPAVSPVRAALLRIAATRAQSPPRPAWRPPGSSPAKQPLATPSPSASSSSPLSMSRLRRASTAGGSMASDDGNREEDPPTPGDGATLVFAARPCAGCGRRRAGAEAGSWAGPGGSSSSDDMCPGSVQDLVSVAFLLRPGGPPGSGAVGGAIAAAAAAVATRRGAESQPLRSSSSSSNVGRPRAGSPAPAPCAIIPWTTAHLLLQPAEGAAAWDEEDEGDDVGGPGGPLQQQQPLLPVDRALALAPSPRLVLAAMALTRPPPASPAASAASFDAASEGEAAALDGAMWAAVAHAALLLCSALHSSEEEEEERAGRAEGGAVPLRGRRPSVAGGRHRLPPTLAAAADDVLAAWAVLSEGPQRGGLGLPAVLHAGDLVALLGGSSGSSGSEAAARLSESGTALPPLLRLPLPTTLSAWLVSALLVALAHRSAIAPVALEGRRRGSSSCPLLPTWAARMGALAAGLPAAPVDITTSSALAAGLPRAAAAPLVDALAEARAPWATTTDASALRNGYPATGTQRRRSDAPSFSPSLALQPSLRLHWQRSPPPRQAAGSAWARDTTQRSGISPTGARATASGTLRRASVADVRGAHGPGSWLQPANLQAHAPHSPVACASPSAGGLQVPSRRRASSSGSQPGILLGRAMLPTVEPEQRPYYASPVAQPELPSQQERQQPSASLLPLRRASVTHGAPTRGGGGTAWSALSGYRPLGAWQ